mmetsp:Transcript_31904/g.82672  ORF Transcript_31904/g.82672 Transcript_31904/m.82672 type:complete len:524 (-) Transcript_31904:153-1724(-)
MATECTEQLTFQKAPLCDAFYVISAIPPETLPSDAAEFWLPATVVTGVHPGKSVDQSHLLLQMAVVGLEGSGHDFPALHCHLVQPEDTVAEALAGVSETTLCCRENQWVFTVTTAFLDKTNDDPTDIMFGCCLASREVVFRGGLWWSIPTVHCWLTRWPMLDSAFSFLKAVLCSQRQRICEAAACAAPSPPQTQTVCGWVLGGRRGLGRDLARIILHLGDGPAPSGSREASVPVGDTWVQITFKRFQMPRNLLNPDGERWVQWERLALIRLYSDSLWAIAGAQTVLDLLLAALLEYPIAFRSPSAHKRCVMVLGVYALLHPFPWPHPVVALCPRDREVDMLGLPAGLVGVSERAVVAPAEGLVLCDASFAGVSIMLPRNASQFRLPRRDRLAKKLVARQCILRDRLRGASRIDIDLELGDPSSPVRLLCGEMSDIVQDYFRSLADTAQEMLGEALLPGQSPLAGRSRDEIFRKRFHVAVSERSCEEPAFWSQFYDSQIFKEFYLQQKGISRRLNRACPFDLVA